MSRCSVVVAICQGCCKLFYHRFQQGTLALRSSHQASARDKQIVLGRPEARLPLLTILPVSASTSEKDYFYSKRHQTGQHCTYLLCVCIIRSFELWYREKKSAQSITWLALSTG